MTKIEIELNNIDEDLKIKLYNHIKELCDLLSDDLIKVNYIKDYNVFGSKKY